MVLHPPASQWVPSSELSHCHRSKPTTQRVRDKKGHTERCSLEWSLKKGWQRKRLTWNQVFTWTESSWSLTASRWRSAALRYLLVVNRRSRLANCQWLNIERFRRRSSVLSGSGEGRASVYESPTLTSGARHSRPVSGRRCEPIRCRFRLDCGCRVCCWPTI